MMEFATYLRTGNGRCASIGRLVSWVFLVVAHSAGYVQTVPAAESSSTMIAETNVMVRMRDGVGLSTDLYRPARPGRYPVILFRDAYGNGSGSAVTGRKWVDRGYVYIVQDVRGRYDSEGHYYPYFAEANDGYDTQQWAGSQPLLAPDRCRVSHRADRRAGAEHRRLV